MNKEPKVSVLMPIYNTNAAHLREAIDSILNQTYSDFEFLILNDSPDNQGLDEIVGSYDDKRIKYSVNKQNLGITQSRNKLIDLSVGEYLAVMDHDDISMPDRFQKQVEFLDKNKDIGVVGSAIEYFPEHKVQKLPESDFDIKAMMMRIISVVHPSSMIRKSVLTENDIKYKKEYSPAEDYALFLDMINHTKFANLPEVLFKYRWGADNTTVKQRKKMDAAYKQLRILNQQRFSQENFCLYNKVKIKLFGFLPFLKIIQQSDKTNVYLFEKILILQTKRFDYV